MKTLFIIALAAVILFIAGVILLLYVAGKAQENKVKQYWQERKAEGIPDNIIAMELSDPNFVF